MIGQQNDHGQLLRSLVGFEVDGVPYAVSIHSVREIVNPIELTDLPHAPGSVAGVADHRGDVVVIVSLRRHLALPEREDGGRGKWILLDCAGLHVGLAVDRVTEVFGTGGEALKPVPEVPGENRRGLLGVTTHKGRLTFVIDTDRFGLLAESVSGGTLPHQGEQAR